MLPYIVDGLPVVKRLEANTMGGDSVMSLPKGVVCVEGCIATNTCKWDKLLIALYNYLLGSPTH